MIIKNLLISISVCFAFALLGNLLIGDTLKWFNELEQPWFALSFSGWLLVGSLYYMIVIAIFFRLLGMPTGPERKTLIRLTIAMLAGNEIWNLLFFGLESTLAGFTGLFPFTALVVVLFVKLLRSDRLSAWVLLPYLLWLVYDLIWAYYLWQLNSPTAI
ncbi:MAG: TspO/MBR family protein [Owenweeksia sp.]